MTFVRRSSRFALRLAFTMAFLCGTVACEVYDGDLPPADELHTPIGLAVHPTGKYLYVLNSNFQSLYRPDIGGTVSVVDLEELSILEDKTLCVPSFGAKLAFSASHYAEDEPRFLFAATKTNRGGVVLQLNEEGDTLSCNYEGQAIGNTCVDNLTDLDGVTRKQRYLPCEVRNIMDDPSDVTSIAPIEGVTPMDQDAFVVIGQRHGVARAVNLVDGEIRGHHVDGRQRGDIHYSPRDTFVASGADVVATHPLTGENYVGARFDNRIYAIRWLREAVGNAENNPRQGFANRIARIGGLRISSAYSNLEVRGLQFTNDGNRLFATSQAPSSLIEIDTSLDDEGEARNHPMRRIPLPGRPGSLALLEVDGKTYAYIALFSSREVVVVDIDAGVLVGKVDVGDTPYTVVADPVRPRIYVALFEENAVAVIDADPSRPTWNRQIATIR